MERYKKQPIFFFLLILIFSDTLWASQDSENIFLDYFDTEEKEVTTIMEEPVSEIITYVSTTISPPVTTPDEEAYDVTDEVDDEKDEEEDMPINDLADKMYDDSYEDESKSSRSLDATTQAASTDTDTIAAEEKMRNMIIIGCLLGFGCLILIVVPCCLVCFISYLKKDELSQAEKGKIGP